MLHERPDQRAHGQSRDLQHEEAIKQFRSDGEPDEKAPTVDQPGLPHQEGHDLEQQARGIDIPRPPCPYRQSTHEQADRQRRGTRPVRPSWISPDAPQRQQHHCQPKRLDPVPRGVYRKKPAENRRGPLAALRRPKHWTERTERGSRPGRRQHGQGEHRPAHGQHVIGAPAGRIGRCCHAGRQDPQAHPSALFHALGSRCCGPPGGLGGGVMPLARTARRPGGRPPPRG